MKEIVETVVKALVRGGLYAAGFALIGGLAGLLTQKGFVTGAYIAVLAASCIAMLVAAWGFIGSPKKRFSFFTQDRYRKKEPTSKEDDNAQNKGMESGGLYPTIIAVEMLIIGFIIEALLH